MHDESRSSTLQRRCVCKRRLHHDLWISITRTSANSHACLISFSSLVFSWIFAANRLSSSRWIFVIPGIRKISSPCAINQANVSRLGVTFFFIAMALRVSTSSKFLGKFSLESRGINFRYLHPQNHSVSGGRLQECLIWWVSRLQLQHRAPGQS